MGCRICRDPLLGHTFLSLCKCSTRVRGCDTQRTNRLIRNEATVTLEDSRPHRTYDLAMISHRKIKGDAVKTFFKTTPTLQSCKTSFQPYNSSWYSLSVLSGMVKTMTFSKNVYLGKVQYFSGEQETPQVIDCDSPKILKYLKVQSMIPPLGTPTWSWGLLAVCRMNVIISRKSWTCNETKKTSPRYTTITCDFRWC